jgi:ATP-dependent Clp protease ATP-binding subunit ClpA
VTIGLSDSAREYLAEQGYDPAMGARPLGRIIQTKIKKALAEELLFGALKDGGAVSIDFADDELTFSFESTAVSDKAGAKTPEPDETVE